MWAFVISNSGTLSQVALAERMGVRSVPRRPLSQLARLEAWLVAQLALAKQAQQVLNRQSAAELAHLDGPAYEAALLRARRGTVLACADALWAEFLRVRVRGRKGAGQVQC